MKYMLPLIAVSDIKTSRAFYETVLQQTVSMDLGANLSFGDGAFALQQDYAGLVGDLDVHVASYANDHELYFEEEDFDGVEQHLAQFSDIVYLHKAKTYPWGQRVMRLYDPDGHIIEVGESMKSVFIRFHSQGMNVEQVAERTSHPVEFVRMFIHD